MKKYKITTEYDDVFFAEKIDATPELFKGYDRADDDLKNPSIVVPIRNLLQAQLVEVDLPLDTSSAVEG